MPLKPSGSRSNFAAILVVVVVTAALIWTVQAIVTHNKLQNCIDTGRRDCLPQPGGE